MYDHKNYVLPKIRLVGRVVIHVSLFDVKNINVVHDYDIQGCTSVLLSVYRNNSLTIF